MQERYNQDSIERRLAAYSLAAAGAVAAFAPVAADAQIVYTDVDPDETVVSGEQFAIDFDEDGTDDVTFLLDAPSATFFRARVFANEDNNGGIAGFGPVATNYNYFYASVLDQGTEVGADNTVDNSNLERDDFLLTSTFGGATYGNWGNEGSGTNDKYVGIRFNAGGGTTHYAWARLDVTDASSITIKDYAFESMPDTPIAAGAGATASDPDALESGYLFSEVAPNPVAGRSTFDLSVGQAETVSAELFDTLGRRVQTLFSGALTPGNTQTVALDSSTLPAGVYVVRVTGDSFVTTRNVTVVR